MGYGPPSRSLIGELAIAALIFVGALSVTFLLAVFVPMVALTPFHTSEGLAGWLYPLLASCVALVVNPVIFAAFVTNHCRRVGSYVIPLTQAPWLRTICYLPWRSPSILAGLVACSLSGLVLAYWIVRRKRRKFMTRLATSK